MSYFDFSNWISLELLVYYSALSSVNGASRRIPLLTGEPRFVSVRNQRNLELTRISLRVLVAFVFLFFFFFWLEEAEDVIWQKSCYLTGP